MLTYLTDHQWDTVVLFLLQGCNLGPASWRFRFSFESNRRVLFLLDSMFSVWWLRWYDRNWMAYQNGYYSLLVMVIVALLWKNARRSGVYFFFLSRTGLCQTERCKLSRLLCLPPHDGAVGPWQLSRLLCLPPHDGAVGPWQLSRLLCLPPHDGAVGPWQLSRLLSLPPHDGAVGPWQDSGDRMPITAATTPPSRVHVFLLSSVSALCWDW